MELHVNDIYQENMQNSTFCFAELVDFFNVINIT